jgi:hypothetical protein
MIHPREIKFADGADDLFAMRFEWSVEELPSKSKWNKYFGLSTSRYGVSLTEWVRHIESELDAAVNEMEQTDGIKVGGEPNSENNKSPCTLGMYVKGFAIFHLYKVVWANPDGPQGKGFTDDLSNGTIITYTEYDGSNPFLIWGITYQSYLGQLEDELNYIYWETGERHWAADFWSNGVKAEMVKETNKLLGTKHDALKGPSKTTPGGPITPSV